MRFFFQSFEKSFFFFQVERLLKNFTMQQKSLHSGEKNRNLNAVANIVAKIHIDALQFKKNQEQMILKDRQK